MLSHNYINLKNEHPIAPFLQLRRLYRLSHIRLSLILPNPEIAHKITFLSFRRSVFILILTYVVRTYNSKF